MFSVGSNVTTTTKKVVNFFGGKVHPRENPGYTYEKRAPALRWYGATRMVNPALNNRVVIYVSYAEV